ncbi:helix-turn-helix transcriptional regulator [Enterococcus sp. JM4C]|uniref:response regulator transcription factor n=1 Tax=Candidatus Enterococcus huntleyi TaxID=1857217 RepID=UPI00137AC606|nr:helix-turn-helix transcriptional regulator [Enterococcus sp. JM4C]KAF1295986.1 helix-turn-helix transcriptional regulator [Enterococcus sp. JM4C]
MVERERKKVQFFSEISEHQISAQEFFSTVLLDSISKNFGWDKVLIAYYDTNGNFLSWTSWKGISMDSADHVYRGFKGNDVVRHIVYEEAVRDHLTYFDVEPRLYKSTDIISEPYYDQSIYVKFIEENFQQHYSVTLAFGINAYIQVIFFKEQQLGDFTPQELQELEEIYVYLANAYKNFKKYEQSKIIQNIQNEIIASGEKSYLVTDDFMHVMSYSNKAIGYLRDILGTEIDEQLSSASPCSWLPFLLGGEAYELSEDRVQTKVIRDYIFKIYTYDQCYSNGIVDRYHWITIKNKNQSEKKPLTETNNLPLTPAEQKVAVLMYEGLTYRAIADELVVSYHTVKKHVQNIYSKCSINSRFELYKWMENRAFTSESHLRQT